MDSINYLRFIAALAFVLALIWACVWVARRYGLMPKVAARGGRSPRLSIVEILPIDARHRAVLLRRDDVEHLVLLGQGECVIESNIRANAGNTAPDTPSSRSEDQ